MFVSIHFMVDYAGALQNRDQSGLAKRLPYGNAVRQRISSQCFKAALKSQTTGVRWDRDAGGLVDDSFQSLARKLGEGLSVTSRLIFPRMVLPALAKRIGGERAAEWSAHVAENFGGARKDEDEEDEQDDLHSGDPVQAAVEPGALKQPIVLGEQEIAAIVETCSQLASAGISPKAAGDIMGRRKFPEDLPQEAKDAVRNLRSVRQRAGLGGLLFGRFSTWDAFSTVDSVVRVAHLMTVHPIQATSDFFSVRDMLLESNEKGAAHTNVSELTSGLFYGFVVIDIEQARRNIAGATSATLAEVTAWVIRAIARAEPAAKLGSTAAYGLLEEMFVEIGQRQPRMLSRAFRDAVRPEKSDIPLSRRAIDLLKEQARTAAHLEGRPEHALWLGEISQSETSEGMSAYEILAEKAGDALLESLARRSRVAA
jgi:CRISPR system Cascade subunit CasC